MQTTSTAAWREAAREDEGFRSIVERHQSMVYSIAWNFFRNRALAEEIAQDTFLQLFRNLDSIESPEHLESWLRRTASHRSIDTWRKKGFKEETAIDGLPEPSIRPNMGDPMLRETLGRLVATLPQAQRMAVILKYSEDLDAEEIAKVMDLPVRTVWSHLRRGVAMLKEKMDRVIQRPAPDPSGARG